MGNFPSSMLILPLLCLHCTLVFASSRFVLSGDHLLEPELPDLHSNRIVHVVTGKVDSNDQLDAIVFYATRHSRSGTRSFSNHNYNQEITYSHRVIYDITAGPRTWQGVSGFHPVRSSGYSEYHRNTFSIEADRASSRCSSGYTSSLRSYYRDWAEAHAFVATDLNNNGKLDVVIVSATGYCHQSRCSPNTGNSCSRVQWRPHINIKTWILSDFNQDGTFSDVIEGPSFWRSTSARSSGPRRGVVASIEKEEQHCPNSHLLRVVQGETQMELCITSKGELSYLNDRLVNMPSASHQATNTAFKIDNQWWYLLVSSGGDWTLGNFDFSQSFKGKFDIPNSASIAVTAVDFDDDGIDDVILIDCPTVGHRCRLWHGMFYSPDFIDHNESNEDYFNELL
ncbi:hypothetical protein P9112_007056 [Eukaryota sp. TZLM1-RC]